MAEKKTAAQKLIKKRWFHIVAPKVLNEEKVGELLLANASDAIGRTFDVNLAAITEDLQKQNLHVALNVTHANGDQLITQIMGLRVMPSALRRLMRKRKSKIDESFVVKTSDGIAVRVKPFAILKGMVRGGTLATMINNLKTHLTEAIGKLTYEQTFTELLKGKLQEDCTNMLKKLYPVGRFELRWVKRENALEKHGEKVSQ